jgi:glycosyltransferase involved in cell wall biosynthesis
MHPTTATAGETPQHHDHPRPADLTPLRVTVAICTWNRCDSLRKTLDGFTGLRQPENVEWELLVINNNCTDITSDVVRRYDQRLPVREVSEPTPGLSHARNRAVAESSGDYIIFADDDVTVVPGWLTAYAAAFRHHPDAAIFGGPIRPTFDGEPPVWLTRIYPTVAGVYAACDLGPTPVPFAEYATPWGANYALRMREQRTQLYDPDLGYRPGRMIGWEETVVIRALLARGVHGWWVPDAALQHHVPPARQTTKYLRAHFYNRGRYYGSQWTDVDRHFVFGRPRWMWRQAITSELRYRVHRVASAPEVWIEDLISSSESWGILNGYIRPAEA